MICNSIYREQRERYHSIRERAEADRSIMSVIMDGMDQNATNMPHLKRLNKSAANLWRLKTHVTGVISHGHGSYAYIDLLQWPHDPNLTINILVEHLLQRVMDCIQSKYPVPKKLYIQLDNCNRENKNRHVLGFCSLLVQEKVFEEVSLRALTQQIFMGNIELGCVSYVLAVTIPPSFKKFTPTYLLPSSPRLSQLIRREAGYNAPAKKSRKLAVGVESIYFLCSHTRRPLTAFTFCAKLPLFPDTDT